MQAGTPPHDPLGAFCRDNHAARRGYGRGPLRGLTFAAKDLFHIKGARTGFGQPDWLASHPPQTTTARAVKRLLDAGADLVAKAHCDELCYSLTGENVHYGTPVNVNAPDRIPGGSSNGSAAAVAGGLVDFALGSDCGGSIRIPASYCGILGLRPTFGRVPLEGAVAFGPSFDVAGWFARDADVFIKVGRVLLADRTKPQRPRRVLVARDAFSLVDRTAAEALVPALEVVKSLAASSEEITVAPGGLDGWFEVFKTIQAAEVWANVGVWVAANQPRLGPGIKERFEWAATVTPDMHAAACARRSEICAHVDRLLRPGDVLCLPSSPRVAPLKGSPTDKIEVEYRNQAMFLLCISGLTGRPQVSLPLANIGGLPLGLSIIGSRGSDIDLLDMARRVTK